LTSQSLLNHTYGAQKLLEEPPLSPGVNPVVSDPLKLGTPYVAYHRRDDFLNTHRNPMFDLIVIQVPECHSLPIVALYPALGDSSAGELNKWLKMVITPFLLI
jgi:hypothetical protein